MPPALDPERVLALRAHRHQLLKRAPAGALPEVAGRLAGFHAQVMSCAELSAWIRVEGALPGTLARALWHDRALVKTWLMRGTLHLLPSSELMLFKVGLHGRRPGNQALAMKLAGVTEAEIEALNRRILSALDGRALSRQDLARELGEPRLRSSWGEYVRPVTARGEVCSGPPRGAETTFVRVDQWLGPQPEPEPEAARREILRRYLHLNGPATLADFTWWAGGEPVWSRPIWAGLRQEMVEVSVDGRTAWMLAADLATIDEARQAAPLRLLGGFDPYVLSHQDRRLIIDAERRGQVSRTAGWISAVLLVRGRVAGVWTHRRERGRVSVEVEQFSPLDRAGRRLLEAEVAGLEPFFGSPCDLIVA